MNQPKDAVHNMHLFLFWVVQEAAEQTALNWQASYCSHRHPHSCHLFSLCFSSAASSLSSAAASPLSTALCLLSVENVSQTGVVATKALITGGLFETYFSTNPGSFNVILHARSFCKKKTRDGYMITWDYCTLMYLIDVSGGDDKPSFYLVFSLVMLLAGYMSLNLHHVHHANITGLVNISCRVATA